MILKECLRASVIVAVFSLGGGCSSDSGDNIKASIALPENLTARLDGDDENGEILLAGATSDDMDANEERRDRFHTAMMEDRIQVNAILSTTPDSFQVYQCTLEENESTGVWSLGTAWARLIQTAGLGDVRMLNALHYFVRIPELASGDLGSTLRDDGSITDDETTRFSLSNAQLSSLDLTTENGGVPLWDVQYLQESVLGREIVAQRLVGTASQGDGNISDFLLETRGTLMEGSTVGNIVGSGWMLRWNTQLGVAPQNSECDVDGELYLSAYSTDYYFLQEL